MLFVSLCAGSGCLLGFGGLDRNQPATEEALTRIRRMLDVSRSSEKDMRLGVPFFSARLFDDFEFVPEQGDIRECCEPFADADIKTIGGRKPDHDVSAYGI
jgi:hypothetical protein